MLDQRKILSDIDGFINDLLSHAIRENASDIHIQQEETYGKIRLRIDGILFDIMRINKTNAEMLISKIKVEAKMDISEKRLPQDGALKLENFENIDFRISTLATVNGEKLVLRILSLERFKNRARLLGFSDNSKEKLQKAISKKSGMVLISGPTGSGKSTSLYGLLESLNTEEVNIVSIEDPVEYKIENINQISVKEKIGLTYPKILRAILRQDPDIIMIGEIRDKETAAIAIRAAITGHLVVSTTHTTDALSALVRLKDLGVEEFLIRSAINALASQRLVRKLCTCKKSDTMTDFEYELVSKYLRVDRNKKIYRPVGCLKCKKGYIERQAVEEVILIDDEFKEILKNYGLESKELKDKLKKEKFRPMLTNGLIQIMEGETSFEEVLKVLDY